MPSAYPPCWLWILASTPSWLQDIHPDTYHDVLGQHPRSEERWRKDALLQHLCTERDLPLTCPLLPISRRPSASLAGTGSQGHRKYLTQRRLGTLPPRPHWGFASQEDGSLTGAGPVSAAETMPLSGLCSCSLSL